LSNLHSGYINQSLEVDEYFPLLTNQDEFDYRTDIFDDEESEEELQFSDDYDVDVEHGSSEESSGDEDDDEALYNDDFANDDNGIQAVVASGDERTADVGLIMRVRRVSTKNEVIMASPPKWINS